MARAAPRAKGVTWHIRRKCFEAHLWNKVGATRKRAQYFVGSFRSFEDAVTGHDIASLLLKGAEAVTNRAVDAYAKDVAFAETVGKEECMRLLRNGLYFQRVAEFDGGEVLCGRDQRVDPIASGVA